MLSFLGAVALLIYALLRLDYMHRGKPDVLGPNSPRTAIVLTGQPNRVSFALKRMEEGYFDRMVVTGFELGLGAFADYMKLSPALRNALESGRIVLLNGATSTFENAIESLCWLKSNPEVKDFVLVTSEAHMPRASYVFEKALPPGYSFKKMISDHGPGNRIPSVLAREWRNYLGSHLVTLFPQSFWRKSDIEVCQ